MPALFCSNSGAGLPARTSNDGRQHRQIVILATDGVIGATLTMARDVFHMAALRSQGPDQPQLEIRIAGETPAATGFSGELLPIDAALTTLQPALIILPAFWADFDTLLQTHAQLPDWLAHQHAQGSLICCTANGVFWAAAAGLLDGHEATTYWRFYREFEQRFPRVQLNRDRHLTETERIFCAAGVSSACDMYLHLIEQLCGSKVAQDVARDALYETQRSYRPGVMGFGGQKMHQDPVILQVQEWLEDNLAESFRFEDLAEQHGMSARNFIRRFQAATGDKPLQYLQRLRMEHSKNLLAGSTRSIKSISYQVGYDDASFFARLFREHTGFSPSQYRQHLHRKTPRHDHRQDG